MRYLARLTEATSAEYTATDATLGNTRRDRDRMNETFHAVDELVERENSDDTPAEAPSGPSSRDGFGTDGLVGNASVGVVDVGDRTSPLAVSFKAGVGSGVSDGGADDCGTATAGVVAVDSHNQKSTDHITEGETHRESERRQMALGAVWRISTSTMTAAPDSVSAALEAMACFEPSCVPVGLFRAACGGTADGMHETESVRVSVCFAVDTNPISAHSHSASTCS